MTKPPGTAVAVPSHKRGQKLAFSFDEDELTILWDAVRQAGIARGTPVAATGVQLPAWWLAGTGLVADPAATTRLDLTPTTVGPAATAGSDAADVEAAAMALHAVAAARSEAEWQGHRLARDGPDTEADFPLGAYVGQAQHDAVLVERMRMPDGIVESWTSIGAGAAPTEFARLQQAIGTYHVVLVRLEDGRRTVGIWTAAQAPATGDRARPVLRRLLRQQGAWRYGMKFAPVP